VVEGKVEEASEKAAAFLRSPRDRRVPKPGKCSLRKGEWKECVRPIFYRKLMKVREVVVAFLRPPRSRRPPGAGEGSLRKGDRVEF
jgi:hypothetical protein